MDYGLKGKTALVMGSSRGIGLACAISLAQEGCQVIISSRSGENLQKAAEKIEAGTGHKPCCLTCDTGLDEAILKLAKEVADQFGSVSVLVTNTGGPPAGSLNELKDKEWYAAFDKLVMGVVRLYRSFLPMMKQQGFGRIINITSISVKEPIPGLLLSNAMRSAVVGIAKTIASEVAPHGITINNIAPGYTDTERLNELAESWGKNSGKTSEEMLALFKENVPMKRLGTPRELASLVTYLASVQAGYITGTTIQVDGGRFKGLF